MLIQEGILNAREEQKPDCHGYRFIRVSDWAKDRFLQLPPGNGKPVTVRRGGQSGYGLTCNDVLSDRWEVPTEVPKM